MEKLGNTSDWLGFSIDTNDKIIESIEDEIASLVQTRLLGETPMIIMQIGRKAAHLLKDFTRDLPEAGFPLLFCKVLYSGKIIYTSDVIKKGTDIIIFTDTIHTGTEMNIILSRFFKDEFKVNRIYCYLKNISGVESLSYLDKINIKDIISLHESNSEIYYNEYESPLKIFYRSRITPMDLDICYNEYTITNNLDVNKLRNLFYKVLTDIFYIEDDDVFLTENIITTNVSELQYDIDNLNNFKKSLSAIFKNNDDYSLSAISIRVKILNRERRDNFVVSAYIELEVNPEICSERGSNINIPICLMDEVKSELKDETIKKIVCPHCVNTHISDYILNGINDAINNYPLMEESEIKTWVIYRPPDYQKLLDQIMLT